MIEGLSKVGIGSRYANRKFADLPENESRAYVEAWAWQEANGFRKDILQGNGLSIVGSTAAHDLFMVTARAAHLAGVKVKVIQLTTLVHEVTDREMHVDILEARALFVWPFFKSDYKDALTTYQRLAVEEFLVDSMDNLRAVFTLSTVEIAQTGVWWSPELRKRLSMANVELFA